MQWAHMHAVWHAGACLGTYHFIQFCSARRGEALGFDARAEKGDTFWALPYVAHKSARGDGPCACRACAARMTPEQVPKWGLVEEEYAS